MRRRRRFGALRRLPSGRWQARYTLASGEQVKADRTFATKTEADRFLARTELDLAGGTWVDPRAGHVTVEDWAARWMSSATHLKPKTRASYESVLRSVIVPSLGRVHVGDVRPMQVREWVASLTRRDLSPSRIRQSYRLLSQLMSAAQLEGLIASSPCVGVKLPRLPEHEPHVLTVDQVHALAAAMPSPYALFTRTLAYTGMRFGEGAGVQRRFVDLDRSVLVVAASLSDVDGVLSLQEPKTHQHRAVTLPGFLVDELRSHLPQVRPDQDALVFTTADGFPIRHPNFMRRVWRPACAAIGIEATPHDLRASHASWLYDMGWSPIEIAARLGHASATVTTKHYARRIVGRDREIATRLDELHGASSYGTPMARGPGRQGSDQ